jgi:4'-phosphopantetheinyl transferase EntD
LCWSAVPVADHSDKLTRAERALTAGFVPRRLRTFSSGRMAARRALGSDASIGVLPDGAPEAPEGWRLSISHTDEIALAAACPTAEARGVGIDIEDIARMDRSLRPYVTGPLDRLPDDAGPEQLTATFSLRESLFKALGGAPTERLFIRWTADAVEAGVEGETVPLRYGWRRVGGHVLSYCLVKPRSDP